MNYVITEGMISAAPEGSRTRYSPEGDPSTQPHISPLNGEVLEEAKSPSNPAAADSRIEVAHISPALFDTILSSDPDTDSQTSAETEAQRHACATLELMSEYVNAPPDTPFTVQYEMSSNDQVLAYKAFLSLINAPSHNHSPTNPHGADILGRTTVNGTAFLLIRYKIYTPDENGKQVINAIQLKLAAASRGGTLYRLY